MAGFPAWSLLPDEAVQPAGDSLAKQALAGGQRLLIEGEVVGILDEGGQRLMQVAVNRPEVVSVFAPPDADFHLGDRVRIVAHVRVQQVTRVIEETGRER